MAIGPPYDAKKKFDYFRKEFGRRKVGPREKKRGEGDRTDRRGLRVSGVRPVVGAK